MSTKENIILTRKEQSQGRHATITTTRGRFYRSESEQLRDAQDLRQAIEEARNEREEDKPIVLALRQEGRDINLEANGHVIAWFSSEDAYTHLHLAGLEELNEELGFELNKKGEIKTV